MKIRYRLVLLVVTLVAMILVGYSVTGGFEFISQDFWFASGLLMLVLMSLVDQPFFSTDANVFMNGTAGLSLLLVEKSARDGMWWVFLGLCIWLIVSSYATMALYANFPNKFVDVRKVVSQVNKNLGKPIVIFSAFFIWGVLRQISEKKIEGADVLFIFWAAFVLINIPEVSASLSHFLDSQFNNNKQKQDELGNILNLNDPNIVEIRLCADSPEVKVGDPITFTQANGSEIGDALILDLREVSGCRLAKAAITNRTAEWKYISTHPDLVKIIKAKGMPVDDGVPISYVDTGSSLNTLRFKVRPELALQRGMIVFTKVKNEIKVYYQITVAIISAESAQLKNEISYITVTANQIGVWNSERMHFEEFPWVPQAGELVFIENKKAKEDVVLPESRSLLGWIPKSHFPVLADINDLVSHNTAILGVTGSGKTHLALTLIHEYIRSGIKVLVLDVSREYYPNLTKLNPTQIAAIDEIESWWKSPSLLGIYQFGNANNLTFTTKEFVVKVFDLLSNQKLKAGISIPAKICLVFEEAHSLIPEFNQVLNREDTTNVNGTAQKILQGRKYGIGSLIITQRTANITKTILNQCNTIIALRCFDQTGLDFLKNYMGQDYATALTSLGNFNAIVVGKGSLCQSPVIFEIPDHRGHFAVDQFLEPERG